MDPAGGLSMTASEFKSREQHLAANLTNMQVGLLIQQFSPMYACRTHVQGKDDSAVMLTNLMPAETPVAVVLLVQVAR
jgi:hypothetical protein